MLLGVGSGLGVLVAVAGGVLTWLNRSPESVLAIAGTPRTFGIVCGVEFGRARHAGAAGVDRLWIAFVVGVHVAPLAWIFRDPGPCGRSS